MRLFLTAMAFVGALTLNVPASAAPAAAEFPNPLAPPAGAIDALRTYLADHPGDAAAGRSLGDADFRAGDTQAAEAAWKAELEAHPDDSVAHARLGSLYAAENRIDEAVRQYELDMPSVGAAAALVRLHARAGDLGVFVGQVEELEDRYRFNPDFLAIEATVFAAVHRGSDALGVYTRIVALRHGSCLPLVARANEYIALHRTGEAIADLQRCLAAEPARYDALAAMGSAYIARNEPVDARTWIDRALAVDPAGIQALINRGVLEGDVADWPAAMRDEEAAIAADPLRSEGYANLASDLLQQHALTDAEATIDAGLRAAPADARLHYLLAQTFQLEGKPAAATRAQYVAALASDEDVIVRAARAALHSLANE